VLHQVSAGGVRHAPVDRAVEDAVGHLADADHAGGHHRVGGQRPTGRVDDHVVGQAHLVAQDGLVVGEAGVQLGHVDRAVANAGALGCQAGRRGPGEVAHRQRVGVDAVVQPGDPGGALAQLGGPFGRRQHDGGAAVGDRGAVVATQRVGQVVAGQHVGGAAVPGQLGVGVVLGAAAAAGGHLGHLGLGGDAGLDAGPGLEGGQLHRGGPQRGGVIGLAHAAEHPGQVAGARLAVAVHQGGVGVARADLQVRLVQRPGAVHLHVALGHGRPGADGVQRHHKAERLPGQVVRRAGAVEVEAVVVEAHLVHRLGDHRLDQLHLAQRVGRADVLGLGKPDDGNVAAC
jgi:hypothetical protein